jgi:hypothetical protein
MYLNPPMIWILFLESGKKIQSPHLLENAYSHIQEPNRSSQIAIEATKLQQSSENSKA